MSKRDTALDEIRTLLAIYTIWAHSMTWNQLLCTASSPVDYNRWWFTPMVAFFFLIGATNALGRKRKLGDFYSTRLSRVFKPYFFFALISVLLCCAVCCLSGTTYPAFLSETMSNNASLLNSSVNIFTPGSPLYWFFPIDKCFIYAPPGLEMLAYHLWFLPVYVIIVLIFPLFRFCYEHLRHKWIPLAVMFALMFVFRWLRIKYWGDVDFISPITIGLPTSVTVYGFWTYLGLYYSQLRHPTKKMKKIAFTIGICGILAVALMLKLPDIIERLGIPISAFWARFIYYIPGCNANHFPPNPLFMVYNIASFPLLYISAPYILKFVRFIRKKSVICDKVLALYENSYLSIYLFSAFAFCIVRWILCGLGIYGLFSINEFIGAVAMQIIMIPICGLFGKWFAPLEEFKFRFFRRKEKADS